MNIEVLEEQWLNSCRLSCSMLLVDFIHFSGLFSSLIYWILRLLVILSDWVKIRGSLEDLEMKNGLEKLKRSFDIPWGAAPTRAP